MKLFLIILITLTSLPAFAQLESRYAKGPQQEVYLAGFCHTEYYSNAVKKEDALVEYYTRFQFCGVQLYKRDGRPYIMHVVKISFLADNYVYIDDSKIFVENIKTHLGLDNELAPPKKSLLDNEKLTEYTWEVPEVLLRQIKNGVRVRFIINVHGQPFIYSGEPDDQDDISLISSLNLMK